MNATLRTCMAVAVCIAVLAAQSNRAEFRSALAKAIRSGNEKFFDDISGKLIEKVSDDLSRYACTVPLPGAESCEVYSHGGTESLKNFVVWFYGEGLTRETAEQRFVQLVNEITQAMPEGWSGGEKAKGELIARDLRKWDASSREDFTPMVSVIVTKRGELYRVTVQLNAVHVE